MPSRRSLSAWISSIRASSSAGETSLPKPCEAEWSVIAMYSQPALARRDRHLLGGLQPVGGGRVHVQVALEVLELDQLRAARPCAPPPARRAPRAARAGSRAARAARRPPPRSRSACVSPVSSSRIPYSEMCSPRRTAFSRSATLCALEPVKCCSTLPNWSGSTTFRSIFIPSGWSRARRRRPSSARTRRAPARRACARAPSGRSAVAMMSRSLTESARRRSEPATSTRSLAGCSRSAASDLLGDRDRRESTTRGAGPPAASCVGERLLELLLDLEPEARRSSDLPASTRRAQRVERVDAELVVELAARAWARSPAGA